MKALQTLNTLPTKKEQQKELIRNAAYEITKSPETVKEAVAWLNFVTKTMEAIRKDPAVQKTLEIALQDYGKGTHDFGDFEINVQERTTYDFSNDPEWEALNAQLKAREVILKSVRGEIYNKTTGEVLTPPATKVSTIYQFRIK